MAVKNCCVQNCHSCSTRKEDIGVTYHKFPKDTSIRKKWSKVTCHINTDLSLPTYVCSRHFCKTDFQIYKDNKYVLKPDAVPSIFPWDMAEENSKGTEKMETVDENNDKLNNEGDMTETLNSSKESEPENVNAIKKFIEDQEKKIIEEKEALQCVESSASSMDNNDASDENSALKIIAACNDIVTYKEQDALVVKENELELESNNAEKELQDETMAVANSVMDMILTESEAKIAKKKVKPLADKDIINAEEKGNNSMSLSVGSKVEAKDFAESWHPAQIMEVDYDEMEVLVHYENKMNKHDEWINVSSPRLRPIGSTPTTSAPTTPNTELIQPFNTEVPIVPYKEDPKHEEKPKVTFVVGERCLARWRDNRRFIATVHEELGEGKYEIMFDDGVRWTCTTTRLSKLKEPMKRESLTIDTNLPSTSSTPSPVDGPGPGSPSTAAVPVFHTHLFDPTRDYLSSKSERREMKRKLNVKELFNIGQKKKKVETLKIETPSKKTPYSSNKTPSTSNKTPSTTNKTPSMTNKTPSTSNIAASTTNKALNTSDKIPSTTNKAPKVAKSSEKKPKVVKKKVKMDSIHAEVKKEIPDAVASIIGTVATSKEELGPCQEIKEEKINMEDVSDSKMDLYVSIDMANSETLSAPETLDMKHDDDTVTEEEKLEKFEKSDNAEHEEVIDRIKEVINKLEDGLKAVNTEPSSPTINITSTSTIATVKDEVKLDIPESESKQPEIRRQRKKNLSKVKKSKKLRLLQEKKVKKEVEIVKCELEVMKKQVEQMRKEMLQKTEELAKNKKAEKSNNFLLPGEWCCKWVNGQPVGTVSEIEYDGKIESSRNALPRRSVQVEDNRLPPGWTKHMVRRSFGHSAGKWDVVLLSPEGRRFHTKTDMRIYLESNPALTAKPFENALMDFGVHLKLSRRLGWYTVTPGGEQEGPVTLLPSGTLSTTSPIMKRKMLSLKKLNKEKKKKKRINVKFKSPRQHRQRPSLVDPTVPGSSEGVTIVDPTAPVDQPNDAVPLEAGYVYVGSLKVQIIENLLRCPAEGCFKNFRNDTLLKMHIKHYHRELRKMLGATPKVLDLAYARQRPTEMELNRMRHEAVHKTIRVKLPRLPRRYTDPKPEPKEPEVKREIPIKPELPEKIPRSQDSPKLRLALNRPVNRPVKRPKVLLPVRKQEPEAPEIKEEVDEKKIVPMEPKIEIPVAEPLDFETAISTHTVTRPPGEKRKSDRKRKTFATISKKAMSEDEEWFMMNNSDVETRSSCPRSGTPDSKIMEQKLVSSDYNEEQKAANNYLYTESGERIKIVHMKREEIINCHCGFREEDGLMVQCELCLCWQHALCHNIQKESDVPEKYTCSICLNPRRGQRSQRFLHDQDRLYEGLLPGAKPCDSLRRSHELSGNLLRIDDALHALRVKYYVATKKDHPKLYLWAKDWETAELAMTQEKLNSDYSDLNIMISNIGKENLPMKEDAPLDIRTPPSEEHEERFSQKENQLGSQALLSGLLSSPGGASLDLPISTSELERLAKTVQAEADAAQRVVVPLPEAAIENSACRERLLRHVQRCQTLIDARLDSIEAQVAELESQDPSFEDDETADYFPRTKQTIQMLMRDLETMEELGVIT